MSTLITFTSRASADVTTMADTARTILSIIGKSFGERGVITVAEIPEALARLDAAIGAGRNHDEQLAAKSAGATPHSMANVPAGSVSVDQRAWPIREMLRESRDANADVMWGV